MFGNFLRAEVAFAAALASLCVAVTAPAQSITLPVKLDRTGQLRDSRQYPYWVSYSDCVNQNNLVFTQVAFGGPFQSVELQVWAGTTSCADQTARTGTAPTCWQVYDGAAVAQRMNITILARDVAAMHKNSDPVHGPGTATLADCSNPTASNPLALGLYFMFMSAGQPVAGSTGATWTGTTLDIWGPPPPFDVSASPGETRIHLGWNITQEPTDTAGYEFFCSPPPGGLLDGGVRIASAPTGTVRQLLEAGTGAGGTTSWWPDGAVATGGTTAVSVQADCDPSSPVAFGKKPNGLYACGSVTGRGATDGVASGLANGTNYVVAVAGVDQVGNVGTLSGNVCATPVEVTDFFELYRQMGGRGGGGFCSFTPLHRSPWVPLGIAASAAFVGILRRRRQR